jgi:hypothetical protein
METVASSESGPVSINKLEVEVETSNDHQKMFMRWLDGGHDLAQPCTWDTLIKCLRHAAFIDVVNRVREILKQRNFFGGILFLTPLHNLMLLRRITLWDL